MRSSWGRSWVVLLAVLLACPGTPLRADETVTAQEPSAEAKAKYEQGLKLKNAGKLTDAMLALRAAIRLTPGYCGAHYALGWVYALGKRKDLAGPEFWEVRRLAPGTWNEREAVSSLQKLGLPLTPPDKQPDKPPTPVTPTPTPPTPTPVTPTPVTPTPVTPTPVTPTPVTPAPGGGGDEVIAPPEGTGPEHPPASLRQMAQPDLFTKLSENAAKRLADGKAAEAVALYRHLLVFQPGELTATKAINQVRDEGGESHKLIEADDRLFAREVVTTIPAEALATWPGLNGKGDSAELKILCSPKLVGNGLYVVLHYPGCDPLVPVVLFTTRSKLTGSYLTELCGPTTGNDKALGGGLKVLTWGHIRAFVKSDDSIFALVRKMGVPTPPDVASRIR